MQTNHDNPAPTLWRVDPTRHPRTKDRQRDGKDRRRRLTLR